MKKIFILMMISFLSSTFSFAQTGQKQVKDESCSAKNRYSAAAADYVSEVVTAKKIDHSIFRIPGVLVVGVGNCDVNSHTVCGVNIVVKDQKAEKAVHSWVRTKSDQKGMVSLYNMDFGTTYLPYCVTVTN